MQAHFLLEGKRKNGQNARFTQHGGQNCVAVAVVWGFFVFLFCFSLVSRGFVRICLVSHLIYES